MATHIATGKFVWWSGGKVNVHDTRLFNEEGLAFKYAPDPVTNRFPAVGLADKGYYSTNPDKLTSQCLITPHKRKRGGPALSALQEKENRIISSVRIEVERSIGRLRFMGRLNCPFRGGPKDFQEKLAYHRSIFNICIHLTNLWIDMYPMRHEPHWLLCLEGIDEQKVLDFINDFCLAPQDVHIPQFLKSRGGMDTLMESDDESEMDYE